MQIIGLGTGYCGLKPIAQILTYNGLRVSHMHPNYTSPWNYYDRRLDALIRDQASNMASSHLAHIEYIIERCEDPYIVVVQREVDSFIKSICTWWPKDNPFAGERINLKRFYPKIAGSKLRCSARKYWHLYYERAMPFADHVIRTEDLETDTLALLDILGIDNAKLPPIMSR